MTTAATATQPSRNYIQDTKRLGIVLGAFFVLTLPLAIWSLKEDASLILLAYTIVFGVTHFLVTGTLYLSHENQKHFASSKKNVLLYFVAPALIMVGFCTSGFLSIRPTASGNSSAVFSTGFAILVGIKFLDYYHVGRQSFGVLQMLKSKSGIPSWMRNVDNAYFLTLVALQLDTFFRVMSTGNYTKGRYDWSQPVTATLTVVALSLFVVVLTGFAKAWTGGDRHIARNAFVYFILQSISAAMAVYTPVLYAASLAMHYVEYHVLMKQRCFASPLDLSHGGDRLLSWFRRHRFAFYLGLLALAVFASTRLIAQNHGFTEVLQGNRPLWLLTNLFNGIFVAHYFVEAMVWKFGKPFYRQTLAALYFPAKAATESPQKASITVGV